MPRGAGQRSRPGREEDGQGRPQGPRRRPWAEGISMVAWPQAGPLLPAGCDRRVPELRVAGEVPRGPRAPWMANDGRASPDPARRA